MVCLVSVYCAFVPIECVATASRYFDPCYHCFVIAVHVDLPRGFCISAVSEQGPVHEYVVRLLALCGCVVRGCDEVLLFVEPDTVQCLSHWPLLFRSPSACLPTYLESIASVSSFAPTCALKSPPIIVCVRLPAPVSVLLELGVHLLHVLVSVSRVREVD